MVSETVLVLSVAGNFALIGRRLFNAATRVSPFVTYGKKD